MGSRGNWQSSITEYLVGNLHIQIQIAIEIIMEGLVFEYTIILDVSN